MNIKLSCIVFAALAFSIVPCGAQAPAGSTGLCKDGTYTTAAKKRGSCNDHKGVKAWFGSPIPLTAPLLPEASPPASSQSPVAATDAAMPATPQTVATSLTPTSTPSSADSPKPAPTPADSVKVWVNLASKKYHCPDSEWYGKTQSGKFMSQADAVAMGAHPAYSKPCSR